MSARYRFSGYAAASLLAAALLATAGACNDDFGYHNVEGRQVAFAIDAPDAWRGGMSVDESDPSTRCTSVQPLSGGDTKLYLHTVVADNPVADKAELTRGTPVSSKEAFVAAYPRFSLSGICHIGAYPEDEAQNTWTPEYAYNLIYNSASGEPVEPVEKGERLLWPSKGTVRFFAFAPTMPDFQTKTGGDGSLALSEASHRGSPTLTYTVPTDVEKQVDLMTARADASGVTTSTVTLNFGHALTAVRIRCADDMLAGDITEVTISGVYGTGTQVIGASGWTSLTNPASYTITRKITLPADEGGVLVEDNTVITGKDGDNLYFMLLPQTLPAGASMTIKFTDKATGTERTLSCPLTGEWQAGKIVTYSISPSSIHISAKVDFSKKGVVGSENPDTIPYTGVWYDAVCTAKAEVTRVGDSPATFDIPADKVKLQYFLDNGTTWADCGKDGKYGDGYLRIEPQRAFTAININGNVKFSDTEAGSESAPFSLSTEYGETANCYLVDKAGYYSLRMVYGNCGDNSGNLTGNDNGLTYFPDHTDEGHIAAGTIPGVADAVLVWQDSPDLVDPASVKVAGGNLVFRIRRPTLAQGNAVLAVRNRSKQILWSWHIWVTPYKTVFYDPGSCFESKPGDGNDETYKLAKYNLGWCDRHGHDEARTFMLQAVIDMSAYKGTNDTEKTACVELGTFTQMEYRGSDAGDNTYYQWGRKDPMLGGIYNDKTPKYKFHPKNTKDPNKWKEDEFNMENKQVFNQYRNEAEQCDYRFRKNVGDMIEPSDEASNGVSIGYTILHPYMFITNSRVDETQENPKPNFNYRNHWHKPYKYYPVPYLKDNVHILFNAWDANSTAKDAGYNFDAVFNNGTTQEKKNRLTRNAQHVVKSVYDPCPPGFRVPPIEAFRFKGTTQQCSVNLSESDHAWTITAGGKTITFPATGLRDYALRPSEWETVVPSTGPSTDPNFHKTFYKTSMPAFQKSLLVSSATLVDKGADSKNAYQLMVLQLTTTFMKTYSESSNSYGLPVRPERY